MNNKQQNQYIGATIRRIRIKRGLTEGQLIHALARSNHFMSAGSLKALEHGDYRPSLYHIYQIAEILGVNMEALLQ